jgi:hypothetical protein
VFIGDYFGLAVSGGNIYALFVSTHYESAVAADEGGTATGARENPAQRLRTGTSDLPARPRFAHPGTTSLVL